MRTVHLAFVVCFGALYACSSGDPSEMPPEGTSEGSTEPGATTASEDAATAEPDAETSSTDAGHDASHDASHDAGADANHTTADAGVACIKGVASPGSGHHNAGLDCQGCHDGSNAPLWTIAGTLYSSASGGSAVSGASIEVTDAKGNKIELHTYGNGNFFTGQTVHFPISVRASKCPSSEAMLAKPSSGACNKGGCHSSMRIHLP